MPNQAKETWFLQYCQELERGNISEDTFAHDAKFMGFEVERIEGFIKSLKKEDRVCHG